MTALWRRAIRGLRVEPCGVPSCLGGCVGLSRWCRKHTDEILQRRHSPELVAAMEQAGWFVDGARERALRKMMGER